ncbi:MAG: sensor histidine kinase [Candidatus Sumerlaeaceae bacterium]
MSFCEELVPLLRRLLTEEVIDSAEQEIASAFGAEHLLIFVRDPVIGISLPAPGFPRTLPGALEWRDFLNELKVGVGLERQLISPWSKVREPCVACSSPDGTAAALIGGTPSCESLGDLMTLLPLVGRGLQLKLELGIATAQFQESRVAIQRAGVLAQSLDALRRELQEALNSALAERARAEDAVAETRRMNEELQSARDVAIEASRAKSAFLANMSHELRTPLNAIIGYAEMIQDESAAGDFERLLGDVTNIRSSGRHLLGLISNILDLSKIEAGKMDLDLCSFFAKDLIEEVANLIEPMARSRNNSVAIEAPRPELKIYSDRIKLRQILVNLASNAVKFTTNGQVTIAVREQHDIAPDCVTFSVTDTGVGIEKDQLSRLFNDFSQLDSARQDHQSGTGLGLAISQRLSEMLGGAITVKSEPGRGSMFSLTLRGDEVGVLSAMHEYD